MPRAAKKPKDPNAPKRPLSSYFIFSNERRAVMAKEMPDKKLTELSKLISVEWKELDADTKATYSQRWQEAKAEYATRLAEYQQTPEYAAHQRKLKAWKNEQSDRKDDFDSDGGGGASSASNSKVSLPRKPKDQNAPKRSKTSYFLFGDSVREETKREHPDKPITEIAKLIGAKWKTLSDDEKQPFSDEAARLKEIYTAELKRYKGSAEERAFARKMEEWKAECERRKRKATVKRTSAKKSTAKRSSRVEEDSSEEESSSGSGEEEDSSEGGSSSEEESSSDSQSSSDGS